VIPDRFAGVKVWEKPFDEFKLARDVVAILSTRGLVRTRELTGFLSLHICYSGAGTEPLFVRHVEFSRFAAAGVRGRLAGTFVLHEDISRTPSCGRLRPASF
jgi:hypothetical protein